MTASKLDLPVALPLHACNAGLFISRGRGTHPTRVIDTHELIFVRQGRLAMQEDGRDFDIGAGEYLLLFPEREHGGTRDYPKDLQFYWIHFNLQKHQPGQKKCPALTIPQQDRINHPDRLAELFRTFLDEQERSSLTALSGGLLTMLMLAEITRREMPGAGAEKASAALAARAAQYICTHFHVPLSTTLIASELRCNPDYLGRVFRAGFGHTLTEEIHLQRLHFVRRELMDSDLNIDEIARSCGYEDVGYFRRIFKRHEGMTPKAYRRLYALMHVNTE